MRARWSSLTSSPWVHPLLFAAFPVLFLWSHNLDQGVTPLQGLSALAAAMSFAVVVLCLLRFFLRDWSRSAVVASVIVILFLTLGRVKAFLGISGALPDVLLVAELLSISLVAVVAARKLRPSLTLARTLNLIGIVLILMNIVPIVAVQESDAAGFRFPIVGESLGPSPSGPERDVYYLVFDRYAGAETLSKLYGFDNSRFYEWLSDHGFEVTKGALANYPQTSHSLASSLNMSYMDDLAREQGVDSSAWTPIRRTLQDSAIARTFQAMGYRYEHIGSWWDATAVDPTADDNYVYGIYTEFLGMFVSTTAVPVIESLVGVAPGFDKEEWNRVHFQIGALREIASDPEPTFTFAHFLLPHPPYIFRADGSFVPSDPDRPVEGAYVDQLKYTNKVIQQIVTQLQAGPGAAPIIVIQSDEGPHPPAVDGGEILKLSWARASDIELGRKLRILNAYYLPGDPTTKPYPTITPVNTFRVILNDYFGGSLPLLPDRTYVFTDYDHPYRFEDVTDRLRGRG
jgi:Sulfatase